MPVYRPRRSASVRSAAPMTSEPPSMTEPATVTSGGNRPSIARAIIDLPEPDDPISPTRSPSPIDRSTP